MSSASTPYRLAVWNATPMRSLSKVTEVSEARCVDEASKGAWEHQPDSTRRVGCYVGRSSDSAHLTVDDAPATAMLRALLADDWTEPWRGQPALKEGSERHGEGSSTSGFSDRIAGPVHTLALACIPS